MSEVDDTSILRTGLPTRYGRPLNWLPPSRLLPRAAGWSAATLCFGTDRLCRPVCGHFRYWHNPAAPAGSQPVRLLGNAAFPFCTA